MNLSAIVLAGERGPGDSVAQAAGVACKALAQVGNLAMLERVLGTLARTERIDQCLVVGNPGFENALAPVLARFDGLARWHAGDASPARSAASAAAEIRADSAILLTTADHPLLSGNMVEELLEAPHAPDTDVTAALVRYDDVMARYPNARCTALRFADARYCGTNLFLFHTPRGRRLLTEWQRVEQARKTPWRVVSLLGPVAVLSYLSGRLSLARALQLLSKRMDMKLGSTLLSDVHAALDVDTVGDLEFVRELANSHA
jgi:CTP:molybdopterin cytidylyltransferase MocA